MRLAITIGIALSALLLASGGNSTARATDPPPSDADFSVDVDPVAFGIQTTRNVNIGSIFNVEVSTNTTDALPWESYQIWIDYSDPVLDGVGGGATWTDTPIQGVRGGNVFAFTTNPPLCTPALQQTSFADDDVGSARMATSCTENTGGTNHTGEGPLAQVAFRCETEGTSALTLRGIADTFLLDSAFISYNNHVHNAQVNCGYYPPGTRHTVDLAPSLAGYQSTRVVPVGQQFSIDVVLEVFGGAGLQDYVVELRYDDVRLTAPGTGLPADWIDPPVLNAVGGNLAPLDSFGGISSYCFPDPGSAALAGENGSANAFMATGCHSGHMTSAFQPSLVQYVLRCDAPGTAGIALDVYDTYTADFNSIRKNHVHNGVVICGDPLADTDGDVMPDTYEAAHACLDAGVPNAASDGDADGIRNFDEMANSIDPCELDSDGDGCADAEELSSTLPQAGAERDPAAPYDFYDVNGSKKIDAIDIAQVRAKFDQDYPPYDRSVGTAPWAPGPPDGVVNAIDVGLVRASYNHSCQAAP